MNAYKRHPKPTPGSSTHAFYMCLLAGLLLISAAGCGVKAPPVPPDVTPPVIDAFTHTLDNDTLSLSWTLTGDSPTPQSYTLYRSRTPLSDDKPCPGCPLLFERIKTVPADSRRSGTATLALEPGYRYSFKIKSTADNGLEGPDSKTIRIDY